MLILRQICLEKWWKKGNLLKNRGNISNLIEFFICSWKVLKILIISLWTSTPKPFQNLAKRSKITMWMLSNIVELRPSAEKIKHNIFKILSWYTLLMFNIPGYFFLRTFLLVFKFLQLRIKDQTIFIFKSQ